MTENEIKKAIACMLNKTWRVKVGLSKADKLKMATDIYNKIKDELGQTPAGVDTEANILLKNKNEGIWIASDNGFYYYWDLETSQYKKGLQYQAVGIADGSITSGKLSQNIQDFISNVTSSYPTELKKEAVVDGGFVQGAISNTTGAETAANSRIRSKPIYVNQNMGFKMSEGVDNFYWIRAYSKTSYIGSAYVENGEIKISTNAPYGNWNLSIDDILAVAPDLSYVRLVERTADNETITPDQSKTIIYQNQIEKGVNLDDAYQKKNVPLLNKLEIYLENGAIDIRTGLLQYYNINTTKDFYLRARTPLFIEEPSNTEIQIQQEFTGMSLIEYDQDFNFIKSTKLKTSIFKTSATTKYIKLYVFNPNESVNVTKKVIIDGIKLIKNVDNENYKTVDVNGKTHKEIPLQYEISGDEKLITKGFLKLPPNYSPKSKSVPLIVFVHGSADINFMNIKLMTVKYDDYYNYLRDNGYAVFDCYGGSIKYISVSNTWNTPMNINCYATGIKYVCSRFNIDENNIFVSCKSLGGIQAIGLAYQNLVKIKAIGCLAPALSNVTLGFGYDEDDRKANTENLGMTTIPEGLANGSISFNSETGKNYIRDNKYQIVQYEPILKNLIDTIDNKIEAAIGKYDDLYMNSHPKYSQVPLKIWCAEDDEAVSYRLSKSYIQMCQSGGSIAELRTMPNGTGGHHSVDTDPLAPKVPTITTPLGITYTDVPLAYVELMQYFEKYRIK